MKALPVITIIALTLSMEITKLASDPACRTHCGSLELKYPFGSGHGCGSPRFHPYLTCSPDGQLRLTTHAGAYPVTSISYADSTLTVAPPCLSNCTTLRPWPPPPAFGLDWTGPFRLADSAFILLSCSSVPHGSDGICDPSSAYLCPSFYNCPAVAALGLPATNSCCVYAPANLGPDDELDLRQLGCAGYSSVVALGDIPMDPLLWRYGVSLKYTLGGLDSYNIAPGCRGCELSGGVCGYAPPENSFVCVCGYGNTTTDCYSYSWFVASSSPSSSSTGYWKQGLMAILVFIVPI